jgi:hypothetical protein
MTCTECQGMLSTDPSERTTAEIAAAVGHVIRCKECFDWHEKKHERDKNSMTQQEHAKAKAKAKDIAQGFIAKIEADHEAMETIFGKGGKP